MRVARRLFVVPLADNDHGKSSIMNALVTQAVARTYVHASKGQFRGLSPWGREIDALVFVRSYQETEKHPSGSVIEALDKLDEKWRDRELIIMPSHITDIADDANKDDDIEQMIKAAHSAGFDIICVTILFTDKDGVYESQKPANLSLIWQKKWDERWTLPNKRFVNVSKDDPWLTGQLDALGRDLWTWICKGLAA